MVVKVRWPKPVRGTTDLSGFPSAHLRPIWMWNGCETGRFLIISHSRFMARNAIPAVYEEGRFVEAGGLMSYGPSVRDLFRRSASYVDKILKGAKPANLPVEQPTKFELVIYLRTAKELGLTVPDSILVRADKIIQ
jgi:ABC-type uncharacterized transport system substrate-binding protein